MKKLFAVLLVALALTGCASPAKEYVNADRQTYDLVAPTLKAYIEADPSANAERKQSFLDLLATWNLRIKKWEEAK